MKREGDREKAEAPQGRGAMRVVRNPFLLPRRWERALLSSSTLRAGVAEIVGVMPMVAANDDAGAGGG